MFLFYSLSDYMDFYNKPYNRMGPYAVGMVAGYILYRTDCRLKINKVCLSAHSFFLTF